MRDTSVFLERAKVTSFSSLAMWNFCHLSDYLGKVGAYFVLRRGQKLVAPKTKKEGLIEAPLYDTP